MTQNFPWLGSQLSLYPSSLNDGSLNIVDGVAAVNSRLLQLLLMRKGEDPLFPEMGFAPDLFAPKSKRDPYLYTYELKNFLTEWNEKARIGIRAFDVRVYDPPTLSNVDIQIRYQPIVDASEQLLTYGFWEYVEAFSGGDIDAYLESVKFG